MIVYSYFLYPLPSLMLHSSTFLTVLLAWHRFNASDRPIEYYISWKMVNPNVSAIKAIIVCLLAGTALVIPLFFEPKVQYETYMLYRKINDSHVVLVSLLIYLYIDVMINT